MLGQHSGLSRIENAKDIIKPGLKIMARLKIGKSVPERQKMLKALSDGLDTNTTFWLEELSDELMKNGVDDVHAHAFSFLLGAELRERELALRIREVNALKKDDYVRSMLLGFQRILPEFWERIEEGRVDSDQVFIRIALGHVFRIQYAYNDPAASSKIFMLDSISRKLNAVWDGGIQGLVKWALERFDEVEIPEDVSGYVLVLEALRSRSGFFLYDANSVGDQTLEKVSDSYKEATGNDDEMSMLNAAAAVAFEALKTHRLEGNFTALMSSIANRMGHRFLVLYVSRDEGGTSTQLIKIPASSVNEAREMAGKLPQVEMHDEFRKISEWFADMETGKNRKSDA